MAADPFRTDPVFAHYWQRRVLDPPLEFEHDSALLRAAAPDTDADNHHHSQHLRVSEGSSKRRNTLSSLANSAAVRGSGEHHDYDRHFLNDPAKRRKLGMEKSVSSSITTHGQTAQPIEQNAEVKARKLEAEKKKDAESEEREDEVAEREDDGEVQSDQPDNFRGETHHRSGATITATNTTSPPSAPSPAPPHAMRVATLVNTAPLPALSPLGAAMSRGASAAQTAGMDTASAGGATASGPPSLPFASVVSDDPHGKSFHCSVPDCKKKYKKLNGLIYHHQTAHSSTGLNDPKPFKCVAEGCDKAYRNSNGLAYHIEKGHNIDSASGSPPASGPAAAIVSAVAPPPASAPVPRKLTNSRAKAAKLRPVVASRSVTPSKQALVINDNDNDNLVSRKRDRDGVARPYLCPHKGCGKAYKNPNGLSYHLSKGKTSGHADDAAVAADGDNDNESMPAGTRSRPQASKGGRGGYDDETDLAYPPALSAIEDDDGGVGIPDSAAPDARVRGNTSHECPSCMRSFRSLPALEEHITTVHRIKPATALPGLLNGRNAGSANGRDRHSPQQHQQPQQGYWVASTPYARQPQPHQQQQAFYSSRHQQAPPDLAGQYQSGLYRPQPSYLGPSALHAPPSALDPHGSPHSQRNHHHQGYPHPQSGTHTPQYHHPHQSHHHVDQPHRPPPHQHQHQQHSSVPAPQQHHTNHPHAAQDERMPHHPDHYRVFSPLYSREEYIEPGQHEHHYHQQQLQLQRQREQEQEAKDQQQRLKMTRREHPPRSMSPAAGSSSTTSASSASSALATSRKSPLREDEVERRISKKRRADKGGDDVEQKDKEGGEPTVSVTGAIKD
ncbi:hypothetical protein HDU86_008067 [Geranomyces michiganensis]|nr:hypothetical protein HDU86_008067 [Geranomyces michiganensis]